MEFLLQPVKPCMPDSCQPSTPSLLLTPSLPLSLSPLSILSRHHQIPTENRAFAHATSSSCKNPHPARTLLQLTHHSPTETAALPRSSTAKQLQTPLLSRSSLSCSMIDTRPQERMLLPEDTVRTHVAHRCIFAPVWFGKRLQKRF